MEELSGLLQVTVREIAMKVSKCDRVLHSCQGANLKWNGREGGGGGWEGGRGIDNNNKFIGTLKTSCNI